MKEAIMMEEIKQLKEKYVKVDTSVLKNLFLSQAEIADKIRKNQEQRCNDDSKIKELTSKLAIMKETLNTVTNNLEDKSNELEKHNVYLEELEVERKKLFQEIKQLEIQQQSLKGRLANPNLQDQQVLEQGKKKFKLYKKLTGIQWDYEASQHSIRGYVTNRRDYIHHFCYENQKINEKLIDSLWHEIYLSTSEGPKDTNESLQPNIPDVST
ncbi:uncharacterized protein LOC105190757 [Harpegnathos saltator]|uniref:uncharacterized protein LOC105190757 n=1 Tax=Harpegnathos saltator TaxID=610380 RepID=UPI000DBED682|nr:uncharacterized protein LOC105190757 [Harpegnathos saltator]XP_025162690.1 uncharacterized protein LOC105190757 [Harpegnathos saltator]